MPSVIVPFVILNEDKEKSPRRTFQALCSLVSKTAAIAFAMDWFPIEKRRDLIGFDATGRAMVVEVGRSRRKRAEARNRAGHFADQTWF